MPRIASWLRLWFTFEPPVGRRAYVLSGLALAALKYAGDVVLVWSATGRIWSPLDYLSPISTLAQTKLASAPGLLPVLAAWSFPFLWIGISMTMRRALDAGKSAWLGLLFFVPGVSYLFIAAMCVLPSDGVASPSEPVARLHRDRLPSALLAIAAGLAIGLGMMALSVYALASYGAALFLGTPFVIGAMTAYLFNRRLPASASATQQIVFITLVCIGGVLLVTAAEGALCILMAAPLAMAIGALGASLGRHIALHDHGAAVNALLAVAVLPISASLDAGRPATGLREVRSAIEIDAPPDVVWRNVISFPPLPEPSELVFRAGIAYPQRAAIVVEGAGAVRRCVFSTGAFVEPITRWEPGRRLSFDVTEQPRPLQEWSPYASISPPHLDGYFQSRRGEFRLVALPGNRTRLEGSTWYEMRLQPAAYWVLYGDAIIARIHRRVLRHIREVTDDEMTRRATFNPVSSHEHR